MMTKSILLKTVKAKDKIIVALDVETVDEARKIIDETGDQAGAYKIGLQLFSAAGATFVEEIVNRNLKVFLDLKFHDIPNTVAKASVEIARLGVWMFNLHAVGGSEMMRRTNAEVSEFCDKNNLSPPKIIAVTVLTSFDRNDLMETGVLNELGAQVVNLAKMTEKCGLGGVVASSHEISLIRKNLPNRDFLIVTPGIRPEFATNDDQKRVMTPKQAIDAGADFLVIGRAITKSADKSAAVEKIIKEIESI